MTNNQPQKRQDEQPGREVNAFIYQQIQEFETVLDSLGGLSVNIETETDASTKKENYRVQFAAGFSDLKIKGQGQADNIFEACIEAKGQLKTKINKLLNAMPQELAAPLDKNQMH